MGVLWARCREMTRRKGQTGGFAIFFGHYTTRESVILTAKILGKNVSNKSKILFKGDLTCYAPSLLCRHGGDRG